MLQSILIKKRIHPQICTLLLILQLLTSCTQAPPPKYNALETLILHEAFDAISEKNYQLAIHKLERMQELRPNAAIIHTLKSIQEENLAIQNARSFLHQKDIPSARDSLTEHIKTFGMSEKLLEEENKIENLIKIKNYTMKLPFKDADAALKAVANLPLPDKFTPELQGYQKWQDEQIQMADHLAEVEKIRLIHEIMDEIDLNLVTSSELYLLNIAQIGTLNIDQSIFNNWLHLIFGLENTPTQSELQNSTCMFKGVDHWQSTFDYTIYNREILISKTGIKPANKIQKILTPASLSGLFVHIKQLFRNKHCLNGYVEYKKLFGLTPDIQGDVLFRELNPRVTSDSKSPVLSLSIDSVLNHIYAW